MSRKLEENQRKNGKKIEKMKIKERVWIRVMRKKENLEIVKSVKTKVKL